VLILEDVLSSLQPIERQLNLTPESRRSDLVRQRMAKVSLLLSKAYYLQWLHDEDQEDNLNDALQNSFSRLKIAEDIVGETREVLELKVQVGKSLVKHLNWRFRKTPLFQSSYKKKHMEELIRKWEKLLDSQWDNTAQKVTP
jgi:hypothetical protein